MQVPFQAKQKGVDQMVNTENSPDLIIRISAAEILGEV